MPQFDNEAEFEKYIRSLLKTVIEENKIDAIILDSKKIIDIVILIESPKPACMFLELKYSKNSSGRIGIGQAKGRGFQPEILKERFEYFESNLRWILAHEDRPSKYFFVDNNTIRKYLSGDCIGEKYNNIQPKFLEEEKSSADAELKEQLKKWLQAD